MTMRNIYVYYDSFFFHYLNSDSLTFMSMCDNKFPPETAFAFLEELKTVFFDTFNLKDIENAISYSLNTGFKDTIKSRMDYYNKNLEAGDNISKLKKGVIDFKDNVLNASDVLAQRGEKINLIVKKAETLKQESFSYYGSVYRNSYINIG